jgi:cytoskeletal protein CcmA (bactofilin family)
MFTKTPPASGLRTDAAPTPPAAQPVQSAAPAPARTASLIAKDVRIVGDIFGEGELQIDGMVKGQVRAGRVIVGDGGYVEGQVQAQLAEVRGKVLGTVTARQVRLYGTAQVEGDITHEQLAMETGAQFVGRSVKHRPEAVPAAVTAPRPAEFQPAAAAPAQPATTFSGMSPMQPAPYPAAR